MEFEEAVCPLLLLLLLFLLLMWIVGCCDCNGGCNQYFCHDGYMGHCLVSYEK